MKKTYNKLTCLFGHHDYSEESIIDTTGHPVCLCKVCKRSGHFKCFGGEEAWHDYDEKGNLVHSKWNSGNEYWYDYIYSEDGKGNLVHTKWSDGYESWKGNDGYWLKKKPKNWKYEKCITH